jgi:hypothetical protein
MQCIATPCDLLAALTPTSLYWRTLQSRIEDLDRTVTLIATEPLFQHTYGSVHGRDLREMLLDIRSATSLMAANIFTRNEIETFCDLGYVFYLNHGLALAARHLRPRAPTIPDTIFVQTARMRAFSFILKLLGEDLKEPRPVLQDLVGRLDLDEQEKMSLLHAAMVNCANQSSKIVHH